MEIVEYGRAQSWRFSIRQLDIIRARSQAILAERGLRGRFAYERDLNIALSTGANSAGLCLTPTEPKYRLLVGCEAAGLMEKTVMER
jgi:hypothetical protein